MGLCWPSLAVVGCCGFCVSNAKKNKKQKRKEKKYTWDSRRSCVSSPVCSRNGGGRVWARGGGGGGFVGGVVIVVVVVVVMVKWRVSRKGNVDVTLTIR